MARSFSKAVQSVLLSDSENPPPSLRKTTETAAKVIACLGSFDVNSYHDNVTAAIFRRVVCQFSEGLKVRLFSSHRAACFCDGEPVHSLDDLDQLQLQLDACVIGGGEVIRFDPSPHSDQDDRVAGAYSRMLLLPILHPSLAGKPVAWNMPGLPHPFTVGQQLVLKEILQTTGYISVRHPEARGYLHFWDGEIHVVPDSAFLLSKYFPKQKLRSIQEDLCQRLGLRGDYMILHASPVTPIVENLTLVAQHVRNVADALGLPVLLLSMDLVPEEVEFLAKLERHQPSCFRLISQDFHPLEITSLIAHSHFNVGTDLLSNVTAASYGVPCAIVNRSHSSELNQFGTLTDQLVVGTWEHLSESAAALKSQRPLAENRLQELQELVLEHFHQMLSYIAEAKPRRPAGSASVTRLIGQMIESERLELSARVASKTQSESIRIVSECRNSVLEAELENIRLAGECRKMELDAELERVRISHLQRENAHLAQLLNGTIQLNERMKRSWVWLPLKPFRWLERVARRQRKWIQAKYFSGKMMDGEHTLPSLDKGPSVYPRSNSDRQYERWIDLYREDGLDASKNAAKELVSLSYRPCISVLMPVYNTPERMLRRAIESVLQQFYGQWELCIADDASTEPHVKEVLLDFAGFDSRIKVMFREHNGHISEASNSALNLARGEFCALLDHDDELSPDALSSVICELNKCPDANLIYSDYDRIGEDGLPYCGYFKPDWNPDLLLSQNYICHLAVYRTSLLHNVGGFRKGYEGSQDWDLSLRVSEACKAGQIRHIPKVLYHWRKHEQSASYGLSSGHYAVVAAKNAVTEHLERRKLKADVIETPFEGWFRVRYEIENPPLVSVIVCTRDRIDLLRPCVDSILKKTAYTHFEILIVDNNSRDPEMHAFFNVFTDHPRVRVIKDDAEFNYSALNNRAVTQARGEVLCFLNNDTVVISSEWLDEMVSHAVRAEIGVVGAKLLFPDGRIQHAGVVLGIGGFAGHVFSGCPGDTHGYMGRAQLIQNYTALTGACMVVRRSVFLEVGGFNETELKVSFNDIDFCLKVHAAGYRNLWTPYALLYHYQGATRGEDITVAQKEQAAAEATYFRNQWRDLIYDDPAYNPNLSLSGADYEVAFPPRACPALLVRKRCT